MALLRYSILYRSYWWPRRKLGGKLAGFALLVSRRTYFTEASQPKPYDPLRDVDFVVPKRLQEGDILQGLGTIIADDLRARSTAEGMPVQPATWLFGGMSTPSNRSNMSGSPTAHGLPLFTSPSLPQKQNHAADILTTTATKPKRPLELTFGDEEITVSTSLTPTDDTPADSQPIRVVASRSIDQVNVDRGFTYPPTVPTRTDSGDHTRNSALLAGQPRNVTGPATFSARESTESESIQSFDESYDHLESETMQEKSNYRGRGWFDIVESSKDNDDFDEDHHKRLEPTSSIIFPKLAVQPSEMLSQSVSRTIHILGLGTTGKFIAYTLASLTDPPPVTLLMHRPLLMQKWYEEGAAISLSRDGQLNTRSGFNIESSTGGVRESPSQRFLGFGSNLEFTMEPPNTAIDTLIVTTEPSITASALLNIRRRLSKSSTIYFLQDGLGVIDRVNDIVFPDPIQRPTYFLGRITHGLAPTRKAFTVTEYHTGTITCSRQPRRTTSQFTAGPRVSRIDFSWTPQEKYLVTTLTRAPELNTVLKGHKSFYKAHLQQLVCNAVIGPLTVALDCSSAQLLCNDGATKMMRSLLDEVSSVLLSLPEVRGLKNVSSDLSAKKLGDIVVWKIKSSGGAISPMLQDVKAGKRTDIDFYNGYIATRAAEFGIKCPVNDLLINIVKSKQAMKAREKDSYIPFEY